MYCTATQLGENSFNIATRIMLMWDLSCQKKLKISLPKSINKKHWSRPNPKALPVTIITIIARSQAPEKHMSPRSSTMVSKRNQAMKNKKTKKKRNLTVKRTMRKKSLRKRLKRKKTHSCKNLLEPRTVLDGHLCRDHKANPCQTYSRCLQLSYRTTLQLLGITLIQRSSLLFRLAKQTSLNLHLTQPQQDQHLLSSLKLLSNQTHQHLDY
mmetsp:Transcript_25627/g.35982  ORF Transcript_25627/g.35982 Transcript_25627/m.35982 type:complete len:211 (-) Transcript_25627:626-1258(-)